MKALIIFTLLVFFQIKIYAQNKQENPEGTVSYLTSQSTYVKFISTKGISEGDTLYMFKNNKLTPVLLVKNMSSTSVVCVSLLNYPLNLNDKIFAKSKAENKIPQKNPSNKPDSIAASEEIEKTANKEIKKILPNPERIYGNISASSSSGFSNTSTKNSQVQNYSLALNIDHIGKTKLSFESFLSLRQEDARWNKNQNNLINRFMIYNLSLKYNFDNSTYLGFGRKINPNLSNISAIDGLQGEKAFKNIFIGGFVGSRPNFTDYSYNINLLQYGSYIGHNMQTSSRSMQNTLAIVEQTNHTKTDRRFFYFQHNNYLLSDVNIFYSLEMDYYRIVNEVRQNTPYLTNTFLSIRYRPIKALSLSGTYDARKNVIYFETDKTYIKALIDEEMRQGISLMANYTFNTNFFAGAKGGYRFQKNDPRASKNVYAFITYSDFAKSRIYSTLSATMLETIYLNGIVYNLMMSRGYRSDKMNIGVAYSYVDYKILYAEDHLIQHIAEITFTAEILKKISMTLRLESDFEKANTFNRIYAQIRKRF